MVLLFYRGPALAIDTLNMMRLKKQGG